MRIVIASEIGFCSGVRHAITTAEKALKSKQLVASADTLLHNAGEMERLESLGLKRALSLDSDVLKNATVLLPTHGSTIAEYADWSRRAALIQDLTCPIVNRARGVARRFAAGELPVIVVGDRDHRETRYLMEAAGNELAGVVGSLDDLDRFTIGKRRVGVVYQTTQSREFRRLVLDRLHSAGVDVVEEMTLCPEVLRRQDEAVAVARISSVVLVLGDPTSANTIRLVAVAREECLRTYLVSVPSEVATLALGCSDTVGIVSGTSCPQRVIDGVLEELKGMCAEVSVVIHSLTTSTRP